MAHQDGTPAILHSGSRSLQWSKRNGANTLFRRVWWVLSAWHPFLQEPPPHTIPRHHGGTARDPSIHTVASRTWPQARPTIPCPTSRGWPSSPKRSPPKSFPKLIYNHSTGESPLPTGLANLEEGIQKHTETVSNKTHLSNF